MSRWGYKGCCVCSSGLGDQSTAWALLRFRQTKETIVPAIWYIEIVIPAIPWLHLRRMLFEDDKQQWLFYCTSGRYSYTDGCRDNDTFHGYPRISGSRPAVQHPMLAFIIMTMNRRRRKNSGCLPGGRLQLHNSSDSDQESVQFYAPIQSQGLTNPEAEDCVQCYRRRQ